ncbi:carboxypeptidase-like regulatory domain-containing protein [Streptomyces carpinensis]|uniref:Carboxypeptidase-like regulatory domain-containing protein n=1 Tax=Streptomyces carpinensis TaxID=66369 RepID=A0ABV1VVW2_9ACTN
MKDPVSQPVGACLPASGETVREPLAVGAVSGSDARLALAGTAVGAAEELFLPDLCGIRGTVRNASGVGVAGAAVTVISPSGQQLGRSVADAEGSYAVDASGPGSYVVIVAAEGHQPHASTITVGAEVLSHDIVLSGTNSAAGASVRGVVSAGAGASSRPLPDARVTLVDTAGAVVATVTTGEDGAYAFTGLAAGEYSIVASGYPPVADALQVGGAGVDGFVIRLHHARTSSPRPT